MRSPPRRIWLAGLIALAALSGLALGLVVLDPSHGQDVPGECFGASALDLDCHARRYEQITERSGAEAALAELKRERRSDGFVRAACHRLTHEIGIGAYGRHNGFAGAYAHGDRVCSYGYYHGVVEAAVDDLGLAKVRIDADGICARLRQDRLRSQLHYNCAHGVGHGFMRSLGRDVFESLEACDSLSDWWESRKCYGGVFMHNVFAADGPSRSLRAAQPLYPCTVVARRYKSECYDEQIAFALSVRNDDFAQVFRLCKRDAERTSRPACYAGIGSKAAIYAHKQVIGEPAQAVATRRLCLLGPSVRARSDCVVGAIATIYRDYEGHAQARALCESLRRTRLRARCARTMQHWAVEVTT